MPTLSSVPVEILLLIASNLPPSGRLALHLSSKDLYLRLPSPSSKESNSSSSSCETQALKRNITERALLARNQRRCILCHAVHSTDFFINSTTPICKWHEGWFRYRCIPVEIMPVIQAEMLKINSSGRVEVGKEKWIPVTRMYCAHERNILPWGAEGCSCGCSSCGRWEITSWIRLSGGKGGEVDDVVRLSPAESLTGDAGVEMEKMMSMTPYLNSPGQGQNPRPKAEVRSSC